MEITPTYAPAPLTSVTLTLTPAEWHDLQMVASISSDALRVALKKAANPWIDTHTQTYDVYALLERIARFA